MPRVGLKYLPISLLGLIQPASSVQVLGRRKTVDNVGHDPILGVLCETAMLGALDSGASLWPSIFGSFPATAQI